MCETKPQSKWENGTTGIKPPLPPPFFVKYDGEDEKEDNDDAPMGMRFLQFGGAKLFSDTNYQPECNDTWNSVVTHSSFEDGHI